MSEEDLRFSERCQERLKWDEKHIQKYTRYNYSDNLCKNPMRDEAFDKILYF